MCLIRRPGSSVLVSNFVGHGARLRQAKTTCGFVSKYGHWENPTPLQKGILNQDEPPMLLKQELVVTAWHQCLSLSRLLFWGSTDWAYAGSAVFHRAGTPHQISLEPPKAMELLRNLFKNQIFSGPLDPQRVDSFLLPLYFPPLV